jgi:hypothetical protein
MYAVLSNGLLVLPKEGLKIFTKVLVDEKGRRSTLARKFLVYCEVMVESAHVIRTKSFFLDAVLQSLITRNSHADQ